MNRFWNCLIVFGLAALVLAARLPAQDPVTGARLSGPVLGFVDDADAGIRPMLGVPGSALLGPAVRVPGGLSAVAFAPVSGFALALAGDRRQPVVVRGLANAPAVASITGLAPGADRFEMSPTGSAAAFLYQAEGKLRLVSGLPDDPRLAAEFDLSGIASDLGALAVSDDAGSALAVSANEGQAWLLLCRPNSEPKRWLAVSAAATLSFFPGTSDAALADPERNHVSLVKATAEAGAPTLLASASNGVAAPAAVVTSLDGRWIVVANSNPTALAVIAVADGTVTLVPCDIPVPKLYRLGSNALFRLTDAAASPIWLLDGDSSPPRMLFVPRGQAGPKAAPAGQGGVR